MSELTKVTITRDDRERLYWLQFCLFKSTGKKYPQEDALKWLLDFVETNHTWIEQAHVGPKKEQAK